MNCVNCEWMKSLEDNMGRTIYFCMNTEGGNYLGETGLCGWCDLEPKDSEEAEHERGEGDHEGSNL